MRNSFSFGIFLHLTSEIVVGTLKHAQVFNNVVELKTHTVDGNFSNFFGALAFGPRQFECGRKEELATNSSPSNDDSPVELLEKVVSLDGVCWLVKTREFEEIQICIGNGVQGTKPGLANHLADADIYSSLRYSDDGFIEEYTGSGGTFEVQYACSHPESSSTEELPALGNSTRIRIASHLFCHALTNNELLELIRHIPKLRKGSSHEFWSYDFLFPDLVKQVHLDSTGQTLNETYVLGTASDEDNLSIRRELSFDPDDLLFRHILEYKIRAGDMCHKHELPRESIIKLKCPESWENISLVGRGTWTSFRIPSISSTKNFFARISEVYEEDFCSYTLVVESTSLCIDSRLIPRLLEPSIDTILCSAIN
jgi:hypothetical protein